MAKDTCKGIVLKKIDYGETSLIIRALTDSLGVKSFLFQGAKRKKKNGNIIQSLSLVNIEYYSRNDNELAKIIAVESAHTFKTIPFNPYKSSILFFLTEVIQKTLLEHETEPAVFTFLENTLIILDETEHYANFVPKFLLKYPNYLGYSLSVKEQVEYFDFQEGRFVTTEPNHSNFVSKEQSAILLALLGMKFDGKNDPKLSLETRRELIYALLKAYHVFFENFHEIKSIGVLEVTLH